MLEEDTQNKFNMYIGELRLSYPVEFTNAILTFYHKTSQGLERQYNTLLCSQQKLSPMLTATIWTNMTWSLQGNPQGGCLN